jgi:hypothetical protein
MGILLRFPKPPQRHSSGMAPVVLLRPHQRTAWQCLSFAELLNEWERNFLASVREKRDISDRERNCLNGIACRIERERR